MFIYNQVFAHLGWSWLDHWWFVDCLLLCYSHSNCSRGSQPALVVNTGSDVKREKPPSISKWICNLWVRCMSHVAISISAPCDWHPLAKGPTLPTKSAREHLPLRLLQGGKNPSHLWLGNRGKCKTIQNILSKPGFHSVWLNGSCLTTPFSVDVYGI